jgi:hypothetical protein
MTEKITKKIDEFKNRFFELMFTFVFKELLYVLLPLIVIFFTYSLFGKFNLKEFLASSNVSFAVVVLNAMTLSSFIEFKVQHQDSKSFTLFEGSKLYIILIVISTLVLSFIILNEIDVLESEIEIWVFGALNVFIFSISCISILTKNSILISDKDKFRCKHPKVTGYEFLESLNKTLATANNKLDEYLNTLRNADIKKLKEFPDDYRSGEEYIASAIEKSCGLLKQNQNRNELLNNELKKIESLQEARVKKT